METAIELENAGDDYETELLFGLDLILGGLERYEAQGGHAGER